MNGGVNRNRRFFRQSSRPSNFGGGGVKQLFSDRPCLSAKKTAVSLKNAYEKPCRIVVTIGKRRVRFPDKIRGAGGGGGVLPLKGQAMNNCADMQKELKELVELVRLDEKFTVVIANGALPLDQLSNQHHQQRLSRISELSEKYGIA